MGSRRTKWGIAGAVLALLPASSLATDFSIADSDYAPASQWQITLTPYAWAPSLVADFKIRGYNVHAAASFYDLIKNADLVVPLMGAFELRNGRFSLFGDAFYAGYLESQSVTFNPIAELDLTFSAKERLIATLGIAQANASWEVARWQQSETAHSALDLYAGARYWYVSAGLTLDLKETIDLERFGWKRTAKQRFKIFDDVHWVDPVVGMRVRQQLSPGHDITFIGDIGGFGVGSEFSWQVYGGYTRTHDVGAGSLAASFGYRVLAVERNRDILGNMLKLDALMHGPMASLSLTW